MALGEGSSQQQRGRWRLGRQRSQERQQQDFICGSPSVLDGRSIGDRKPLFLVLPGQHGRQGQGLKRGQVVGDSEGVIVG